MAPWNPPNITGLSYWGVKVGLQFLPYYMHRDATLKKITVSRLDVQVCQTDVPKLTRLEAARCVSRHTSYFAGVSRYQMKYNIRYEIYIYVWNTILDELQYWMKYNIGWNTTHNLVTHREIFSKSYQIKLKSEDIYHSPIDLEQQTDTLCLLFQIKHILLIFYLPRCSRLTFFYPFHIFPSPVHHAGFSFNIIWGTIAIFHLLSPNNNNNNNNRCVNWKGSY